MITHPTTYETAQLHMTTDAVCQIEITQAELGKKQLWLELSMSHMSHRLHNEFLSLCAIFIYLFIFRVYTFIDPIITCKIKSFHHKNVEMTYIRNLISVYISNFDWVERQTWKMLSPTFGVRVCVCLCVCLCHCETMERDDSGFCGMVMLDVPTYEAAGKTYHLFWRNIIALLVSVFSSHAHVMQQLYTWADVVANDTRKIE